MARGAQKEQARQRAQKEAAKRKEPKSQLAARAAGLTIKCPKCLIGMPAYTQFVQHMTAKHPKEPIPPESTFKS
ncbi:hypothetical protein VTP01DRAFT_10542 [Rhizomucor pusillus]|uniref:uncharacterized protein n=1 Tax=Rhizomucor pusillus TaxID=4840 RepID=UPI0037441593